MLGSSRESLGIDTHTPTLMRVVEKRQFVMPTVSPGKRTNPRKRKDPQGVRSLGKGRTPRGEGDQVERGKLPGSGRTGPRKGTRAPGKEEP